MSIEQTPRFRYLLGLNQPAAQPYRQTAYPNGAGDRRGDRGEFLVEVFPESQLGPDGSPDLRSGALEFFMAGATLGEVAPTSALPLLRFAFQDSKAAFAALAGNGGRHGCRVALWPKMVPSWFQSRPMCWRRYWTPARFR